MSKGQPLNWSCSICGFCETLFFQGCTIEESTGRSHDTHVHDDICLSIDAQDSQSDVIGGPCPPTESAVPTLD